MLASSSTRNHGTYYRTRAAVLCFGGWGLQTMLHLWPRLRLIQEERQVLGLDRELPNLDRLTAFAAILPGSVRASRAASVPAAERSDARVPDAPLRVLQPNLDRYPAPFYLERQLAVIEAEAARKAVPGLTRGERVGDLLLQRVEEDGYVQTLPVTYGQATNGGPERLATRGETFRAGITTAGPIVRALLSQVIDPTRLDNMQTRDPFVQTTIYVIAPLSEPRASALVWPIVSELVRALRGRHVSRVIAFFSTASFAPDDGRAIEEATVHMALRELEALTGAAGEERPPEFLSRLIADCGGAAWEERVGSGLFDMVHLVDREKSNQALAESALDLSVLTGDAIEAFLAADGLGYLERSLGPETVTGRPSYSVLGAASDHVPLAEYISAAIEEEQKRIVRSAVLGTGERPVTEADLQALGATSSAFVRRFLDATGRPLFELPADRPVGVWPPTVRVAEAYLLSKADASDLRETHDPLRWLELLKARTTELAAEIKGAYGAALAAWGLASDRRDGEERGVGAFEGDPDSVDGVMPAAADLAARQIIADMRSAPDGIQRARARLSGWLEAVGARLYDLQPKDSAAGDADHVAYQARMDAWQWAFTNAAASYQRSAQLWRRILTFAGLGWVVLAAFILLQRSFALAVQARIALVAALAGALILLGIAAWYATAGRMRRLRRQRIELLQEEMSDLATRLLRRGLFNAYSQLAGELARLQAVVNGALASLADWARAEPEFRKEAVGTGDAPTRAAVTHSELWDSVLEHLRRESANGEYGLARFRTLWHNEGDASLQWLPDGDRLARRLRAGLGKHRASTGDASAIVAIFKEYVARATDYLCPTHQLFADHPDLLRKIIEDYSAERLLLSDHRHEAAGAGERNGADIVENLYVRAKPSASFDVAYLLSSDLLEVEFGVSADGPASPLHRLFEQRGIPLLTSKDPLTLSVVRTVNRLGPSDLILTERCRDEFSRLSQGDRRRLSLFSGAESSEEVLLYEERDEAALVPGHQLS